MSGLRLTNTDLGTVTLHDPASGVYGQLRYVPMTPEQATIGFEDALSDGGEMPIVNNRNVTETARIYLEGASEAAVRAVVNSLNGLFEQARTFQRTRLGGRVYVEFRPNNTEAWYRSEVLYGRAVLEEDALDGWMLAAGRVIITVHLNRRFFWEGALTYLTLQNGNGTSSAGLTVQNTNDGSRDNWALITSTITGDLPAPIRLEYTNTYASGTATSNLYIGHNALVQPTPDQLTLQAESMAALFSPTPSTLTGASYSNGSAYFWSASGTGQANLGYWNLSSALLAACRGSHVRALARMTGSVPTEMQMRLVISISALSILVQGPWVVPGSQGELVDLGAFQLPPSLPGLDPATVLGGGMQPLTLELQTRGKISGVYTFSIDCISLMPTESWRVLRNQGFGIAQNVRLVDDQIEDLTYTDNWSGGAMGNYVGTGSKILLRPGRTNRLYIMVKNAVNVAEIARTGSLRVAYRPRRLTI